MKILKTQTLQFVNFDVQVAEYAEKVRHWLAHMKRVEEDAADDKVAPIDRHHPFSRPRAPDLIEACVDGDGKVDYELEDDSHVLLRQQKDRLIAQVAELEAAAVNAIVPLGRRRLFNMREGKIVAADAELARELSEKRGKPGLLKKLLGKSVDEENFDLMAAVAEQRSDEDARHLAEQQARRDRIAAIEDIGAQAMHDIEDLTAETIGSWKAPDFSGV